MALLAKRVSASAPDTRISSISRTPRAEAAFRAIPKTSSSRIRAAHLNFAEPGGAGAVPCSHQLLRLALAASRNAPQNPVAAIGNGLARVPELGADAAIARVLQHSDALAVT